MSWHTAAFPWGAEAYAADLYPVTAGSLRVDQVVEPAAPVCPVAVCLSGGGSRALTASLQEREIYVR